MHEDRTHKAMVAQPKSIKYIITDLKSNCSEYYNIIVNDNSRNDDFQKR